MDVKNVQFGEFKELVGRQEGIVLLGTGEDIQEWINGVSANLKENGISETDDAEKLFSEAYLLETTGGRIDLALIFHKEQDSLHIGKMAIWRLKFGDCSWVSDYLVNYEDQHTVLAN